MTRPRNMTRPVKLSASLLVGATLLLAGCASGESAASSPAVTPSSAPSPSASAEPSASPSPTVDPLTTVDTIELAEHSLVLRRGEVEVSTLSDLDVDAGRAALTVVLGEPTTLDGEDYCGTREIYVWDEKLDAAVIEGETADAPFFTWTIRGTEVVRADGFTVLLQSAGRVAVGSDAAEILAATPDSDEFAIQFTEPQAHQIRLAGTGNDGVIAITDGSRVIDIRNHYALGALDGC